MFRVKIDPGHTEGYNRGNYPGYYEGTQMYKLSVYEVLEFKKYVDVVAELTRSLSDFPSLLDRAYSAKGYDLILSNHTNANAELDKDMVLIYKSVLIAYGTLTMKMAKVIGDTMGAPYNVLTRKNSQNKDYYGILRYSVAQGIKYPLLIEHGYHTNPDQAAWMMVDANLRKLAAAKVQCIAEHFGLRLKEAPKPEPVVDLSVKPLDGAVRVIYPGSDGLNVRTAPTFSAAAIDHVVKVNEYFTVVGISTDGNFYKLKSGLYITTNAKYVEFVENPSYRIRIKVPALNIRSGPNVSYPTVGVVREGGVYTIVAEEGRWGKLKSGAGWISLHYTEKV